MQRPPRHPKTPLLTSQRIWWAASQGVMALTLLIGVMLGGSYFKLEENDLRTLVFSSLVLINIGLILLNRSLKASLVRAFLQPNRSLWILVTVVTATLAITVFWPPAQRLFRFGNFHFTEFFVCVAASLLSLIILEKIKSKWFPSSR